MRQLFAFFVVFALTASMVSAEGGSGTPASTAPVLMAKRTVYVLVLGVDPPTNAIVSLEVTRKLADVTSTWVVAEPAWQFADFIAQCANDPDHTAGALILNAISGETGSSNFVIWAQVYAQLDADAFVVSCTRGTTTAVPPVGISAVKTAVWEGVPPPKKGVKKPQPPRISTTTTTTTNSAVPSPTPTPNVMVSWVTHDVIGRGKQGGVPLLSLAAVGTYFAQGKKTTVDTTTTATGSTSVTTDSSLLPTLTATLLATTISQLGQITVPGTNSPRALKHAAQDAAGDLIKRLVKGCSPPTTPECVTLGIPRSP